VLPSLGPGDSPAAFIAAYVRLLDTGPRGAAVSLWLDGATVPRASITISFKREGKALPADRTGMGMGTNAWRYIVAVPGRYTETTHNDHVSTSRTVSFLLVRSSRQQTWHILGVQDSEPEPCGRASPLDRHQPAWIGGSTPAADDEPFGWDPWPQQGSTG
jgi:hypothetical protein